MLLFARHAFLLGPDTQQKLNSQIMEVSLLLFTKSVFYRFQFLMTSNVHVFLNADSEPEVLTVKSMSPRLGKNSRVILDLNSCGMRARSAGDGLDYTPDFGFIMKRSAPTHMQIDWFF